MSEEVKRAMANLLRTIVSNKRAEIEAMEGIIQILDPVELPEPSRSSHYS